MTAADEGAGPREIEGTAEVRQLFQVVCAHCGTQDVYRLTAKVSPLPRKEARE